MWLVLDLSKGLVVASPESSDTVPRSVDVVGLLAEPAGLLSEYEGGFT